MKTGRPETDGSPWMGEITRALVDEPEAIVNQMTSHPARTRGDLTWTA